MELWIFAEEMMPDIKPCEYNWGILDFGAAVCTARDPRCQECALNSICDFYQEQA
jgi:A/G-specific adenine glycosylase